MTINQFLKNPAGHGSAAGARRDIIIENLENRYHKLYKNAKRLFKMSVFTEDSNYFFIFNIPSETYYKEKLVYDVVIQLIPMGSASRDLTLNRYAVKVFSNAPNFLFTYAYVYNKDDIIIDFLKDKVSELALTKPPEKRNPYQEYGFEKSVYFALLYIVGNKHVTKALLKKNKDLNIKLIQNKIISCEEKLEEYNNIKNKELLKKQKSKDKENKKRFKQGLPPSNFKSFKRKRHTYYRSDLGRKKK